MSTSPFPIISRNSQESTLVQDRVRYSRYSRIVALRAPAESPRAARSALSLAYGVCCGVGARVAEGTDDGHGVRSCDDGEVVKERGASLGVLAWYLGGV